MNAIQRWVQSKIRQTDYVKDLMNTAYTDGKRHGREECFHEMLEVERLSKIGQKRYDVREICAQARISSEFVLYLQMHPGALEKELCGLLIGEMFSELRFCIDIRPEKPDPKTREAVYSGMLRVLVEAL